MSEENKLEQRKIKRSAGFRLGFIYSRMCIVKKKSENKNC